MLDMKRFSAPVAPPKAFWIDKTEIERVDWVNTCFIVHPDIACVFKDATEKMAHCKLARRTNAMLLIGGSGAGKTTLTWYLKNFAESVYGFVDPERTICPVLQIQMPDPCTPVEISIAVLEALGDPLPRYGTKSEIFNRSKTLLNQCEVRLVLVDNFHDTPTKRGPSGMKLAGARIRDLMDKSNALWILLGTKDAIMVKNSDPQLVKRVSYVRKLKYFSIKTPEGMSKFKRLLIELEKWLPLAEPSCLCETKMTALVYFATDGIFDRLILLTAQGCIEATRAGREVLLKDDLEKAFKFIFGDLDAADNPFSDCFKLRRLNGPDDPYEILGAE